MESWKFLLELAADCWQMTGKPEVIESSVVLVPTNAPAVSDQLLDGSRLIVTDRLDVDYFLFADHPLSFVAGYWSRTRQFLCLFPVERRWV